MSVFFNLRKPWLVSLLSASACGLALLCATYAPHDVAYVLCIICSALLGIYFGVAHVVCSGKWYTVEHKYHGNEAARVFYTKLMNRQASFKACKRHPVCSPSIDVALQEVLDLVTRDFVLSWYKDLGSEPDRFAHLFQDFIWQAVEEFSRRLQRVDSFKFATRNIVLTAHQHFVDLRQARAKLLGGSDGPSLHLHPWLVSEEKEMEFLRQVAEVFLIHVLPKEYSQCLTVRQMCREIIACSVFKPSVDLICDPDYFNQKVLQWLEHKEHLSKEHRKAYTYAATYEDFIRIIKQCDDIEHLKQMRYNIMSEIMQATTINNLKRAQGIDLDEEFSPKGQSKGDLLKARNLRRYINQLTVAKSLSEKRIYTLGGHDYKSYHFDVKYDLSENIPGRKVLSFAVIMSDVEARKSLLSFLARTDEELSLRFWIAVDTMKNSSKNQWHQLAGDVYKLYITCVSDAVRGLLDKSTLRSMRAFLLGNSGPEAFWDAQEVVYKVLEERFYPSFILSDCFHQLMKDDSGKWQQATTESGHDSKDYHQRKLHPRHEETSSYARDSLQKLREKIKNKSRALKALQTGQRLNEKMEKIQREMEQELRDLKLEKRQLEFHTERTEFWVEHMGKWQTQVFNIEVIKEDAKTVPYFILVVHPARHKSQSPCPAASSHGNTRGWVIFRSLHDIMQCHAKLLQIQPNLKLKSLPSMSKFKSKKLDDKFVAKAKSLVEDFLNTILDEDILAQSETVFDFFSPSPEHLKQAAVSRKAKGPFSLFKSPPTKSSADSDSDDEMLFRTNDEERQQQVGRNDRAAEGLYQLISEVFELKGMFKWFRKTLMAFVQVTFGRSMNRQLRATVSWVCSDNMIVYYLSQFREAYWPGGKLAGTSPLRSDEQKQRTRQQAKEILLRNIPDAVKNLVGEENSNHGAVKIFETLQDARLNKQLFYSLLQEFMLAVFPELEVYQDVLKTLANIRKQDNTGSDGGAATEGPSDSPAGETDGS